MLLETKTSLKKKKKKKKTFTKYKRHYGNNGLYDIIRLEFCWCCFTNLNRNRYNRYKDSLQCNMNYKYDRSSYVCLLLEFK